MSKWQIDQMRKFSKAADIAKELKLDVKTVSSILGEEVEEEQPQEEPKKETKEEDNKEKLTELEKRTRNVNA